MQNLKAFFEDRRFARYVAMERDEHSPELTARMDEISKSMQHQIAPQSWTIVIVGWSVSIITFVAFFIAVS